MSTDATGGETDLGDTLPVAREGLEPVGPSGHPFERIGPYRLLYLLGEGGMGEVWVAEQLESIRRKVAIKVIKAGMDTRQVVARFEAERQALALMDHPAIARVFDGGATPEGRPFFVMEYVPGLPVTEHCDKHCLSTEDRLKLFIQVCEGVQHAHQKAVIHRDLKPSNILISVVDGKAQPKIIDFGIAKATGHRLTDKTLITEVGAVIGTPEYMSPEQADLTGEDVDTRTDVYSLGVILYELLTGQLPFGSKELRASSYEELRRKLREVDPPSPSTRLATPGSNAAEAARRRATDPGSLRRNVQGDLDAITMKALEKERSRRYGTATELAADVARFLGHEPVLARAPSRSYRMQKYVRRHALGVTLATLLVVLLTGFATMATFQARAIALERDRANLERDRANSERDLARKWVQHVGDLVASPTVARSEWAPTLNPAYVPALDSLLRRAEDLLKEGRYTVALQLSRDTLDLALKQSQAENYYTIWARTLVGEVLLAQGLPSQASRVLRDGYPTARYAVSGLRVHMAGRACVTLARSLLREGRRDEAIDVLADGLENGLQVLVAQDISQDPGLWQLGESPRLQPLLGKAQMEASDRLGKGRLADATVGEPVTRGGPLSKHLEAGERYLQLRKGAAAQAEFKKALAAREDPGKAWLGLGVAAMLLNDPVAAVSSFERARTFAPGALLSYNLSCAQARLGRIDDAIASLSDAIDRGFAAPNALLEDPDLAPLRIHPRFPDLLARTRANQERKR